MLIGTYISYEPFTERIVSLNLPTSCFQRKRLSSISKCVGTVSDNEGISFICWKFCINVTFTLSTLKPRYNAIRHVMPPQIAKSVITVTLLPICHDNITKIIKIDVVSLFISRPMVHGINIKFKVHLDFERDLSIVRWIGFIYFLIMKAAL